MQKNWIQLLLEELRKDAAGDSSPEQTEPNQQGFACSGNS